ncbi:hypothetical protein N431DRAFT_497598 [Stipitochalara longipes BDJ]|nr:hypothetical protein N431DRAFT_497598 [Stipitochalara longipes BDJ]
MAASKDPNYSTESRVSQILVGSLVPFTIASVTVLARLITRGFVTRSWGNDDSWILISWARRQSNLLLFCDFEIILTTLTCVLTRYGVGYHQSAITIRDYQTTLFLGYFVRLVYQLVLGTTKIAICTLFLRIFNSDKKNRYAMYSLLAFIGCYTTLFLLTSTFQCHPISDAWKNEDSSTCNNYRATLWATGICNILVDVLLLVFIVPRILTLKIERRQKIGLLVVVSLSVLAIMAAIVRVARVTQFNSSSDETWDGSDITTWSAVESSTGLFCACAAPLKPLYRIFLSVEKTV